MATKNFLDIHGNIIEDILCAEEDSHGLMCPEDKVKLGGIEDGAQKNVQSDWNQNDESADDYIKNRPFYKNGSDVWVHDKETLNFDSNYSYTINTTEEAAALFSSAGNTVYVYLDGAIHECTVEYSNMAMYYQVTFGEWHLWCNGNGDTELNLSNKNNRVKEVEFGLLSEHSEIKTIPVEFIPVDSLSPVMYKKQKLTDEQKNQARKNLDLYYTEKNPKLIAQWDRYGYLQYQAENCYTYHNDTLKVVIPGYGEWELNSQYIERNHLSSGTDRMYYWGNSSIITDDIIKKSLTINETKYNDLPFVLCDYHLEMSYRDGVEMFFDPEVFGDLNGVYVSIYSMTDFSEYNHKIDEKYLPENVATMDDINFDEIEILAETGVADPVTDENGQLLTDENNIIYIF